MFGRRKLFDYRGEVNGFRVFISPLRYLTFFQDLEAEAFQHAGSAAGFEGDHLAEDGFFATGTQVVEVGVHHDVGTGEGLGFGQDVEMEMSGAAGGGGDFLPGVFEDPGDELAGGWGVPWVAEHAAGEEADILKKAVDLVAEGAAGTEKVAFDHAFLFEHEAGLGLDVGVVGGEVVGEELAILKDGVDGLAKVAGLAAEPADGLAIARGVGSN